MKTLVNILTGKLLPILYFAVALAACTDVEEKDTTNTKPAPKPTPVPEKQTPKPKVHTSDEYAEEKVNLNFTEQDKKYLLLTESYPLGTDFKKIHDGMQVKGIRPEGGSDELAAQGLTEAKTKITFLGKPTDLEFNFKNDSMYSFVYTVTEDNFEKAEKLYKGIQQFYAAKYGPCEMPVAEEETRHLRSCYWRNKEPYLTMTYNVNTGLISWGFQNTRP